MRKERARLSAPATATARLGSAERRPCRLGGAESQGARQPVSEVKYPDPTRRRAGLLDHSIKAKSPDSGIAATSIGHKTNSHLDSVDAIALQLPMSRTRQWKCVESTAPNVKLWRRARASFVNVLLTEQFLEHTLLLLAERLAHFHWHAIGHRHGDLGSLLARDLFRVDVGPQLLRHFQG